MPFNPYADAPAPVITGDMVVKASSQVVAVLTAFLLIRQVWTGLALQPGPVLRFVEAMNAVELASWLTVGCAAVWGLFSVSRVICSTAAAAFSGPSGWAKVLTVVSVTALGTGYASGNVFMGLVVAAAAIAMSASLVRRGEACLNPHTLGS